MENRTGLLQKSLSRLVPRPPQTLLIEGGTEQERLDLALFWVQLLNCPEMEHGINEACRPCGSCLTCRQIAANEFIDLNIFDGRISNKADEENPGPVRALTIDNMRELKSRIATAPHGNGKRVAIFQGMVQSREEALNSLLKTLEEPTPFTRFVLLAGQREQLLPTLVSRSLCLTLPWPASREIASISGKWDEHLANFLGQGRGFLEEIGKKGGVDTAEANQLLLNCEAALAQVVAGNSGGILVGVLRPLATQPEKAMQASRWISEGEQMLAQGVTAARVLEGFSTRLFMLLHKG